ncbi:uncharacterized protein J4E92_009546 [Alternaria infectoria]|uniref:uncharacterized protein n=1 Tax=Alternaria infectoria TaxID=45303 RepID=UPI0022206693|nr:uncharacterized protein J4E92_009546 [Alternaria infectoria]KAI4914347.1 hypothetical protein J4E92_009546 [Alternaria infectoria]
MAMSKYENIIWEKEMKDQICIHARILYSRELTLDCLMDVINSTDKLPGCSFDVYKSHVVTINAPTSNAWRVLFSSQNCMSLGESLEETLRTLQERLRPRFQPDVQPVDKETNNLAGRSVKQERVDGSPDGTEEQRLESERPENEYELNTRAYKAEKELARKRMRY